MKRWLLTIILITLGINSSLLNSDSSIADTGRAKILLLTPNGISFKQTINGIKDDLAGDIEFVEIAIEDDPNSDDINKYITAIKPKMLVLLGNKPLHAYTEYQQRYPDKDVLPAVALSALHIDQQFKNLKNIVGIRYEIPAVTSLVQLRSITNKPIRKVGVLYREWMSELIAQNSKFCSQEDIKLVSIEIPNNTTVRQISYHLKHLLHSDIDALWVVNDNGLLQSRTIQNIWIPNLKRFNKPVVVGIKALTNTELAFGTFSVEADQYALGIQGAGLISDIIENGWKIEKQHVYPPVSINNLLNLKLSQQKNIPIDKNKLGQIDQIIQ